MNIFSNVEEGHGKADFGSYPIIFFHACLQYFMLIQAKLNVEALQLYNILRPTKIVEMLYSVQKNQRKKKSYQIVWTIIKTNNKKHVIMKKINNENITKNLMNCCFQVFHKVYLHNATKKQFLRSINVLILANYIESCFKIEFMSLLYQAILVNLQLFSIEIFSY